MKSWRIYVKLGQLCLWCTVQANSVKRIWKKKQKHFEKSKQKTIKKTAKKQTKKQKKQQTKRQLKKKQQKTLGVDFAENVIPLLELADERVCLGSWQGAWAHELWLGLGETLQIWLLHPGRWWRWLETWGDPLVWKGGSSQIVFFSLFFLFFFNRFFFAFFKMAKSLFLLK